MVLNFIRFVSMLLVVMVGSHSLLYFSWVRFFSVTSAKIKVLLLVCLCFLALSFILSSVLIHFFYSPVTQFFYAISGLWYGLLVFLLLATGFLWMIKIVFWAVPVSNAHKYFQTLIIVFYGCSIFYTGYCFNNVFNLKVNRLRVPIKNLPVHWSGKSIAHVSDVHLGTLRGEKYLLEIIEKVNSLNPDIIAITGDLFDGASSGQDRFSEDLKKFKAKRGVFFISGNHEIYAGGDPVIQVVVNSGIQLLDNRVIDLDGLQIIGVGYPRFNTSENIYDFRKDSYFDSKKPSILLFHTPTDVGVEQINSSSTHSDSYLAPKTRFETAVNAGVSLQLSGHTHAGQFFPFTWLTKKIYNGFHYGLHQIGDFYIYIHSGTGTWGPPLRSVYPSEIALITLDQP